MTAPGRGPAALSPQLQSVAWQALGSAATLGAALWVTWRFGLAAQGHFGLAKSWFDAAAVIAALGLPQGLLHLQYRRQVSAAALWPWLRRGLLWTLLPCAVAAAAAVVLAAQPAGVASAGSTAGSTPGTVAGSMAEPGIALLAAAVLAALPASVGHLLARSLLLPNRGPVVFGVVTALPALLLLAGVLWMGLVDADAGFEWTLLATVWLAGLVSLGLAARLPVGTGASTWPAKELWTISLQSWLQAALGGLLAAGLLSVVAGSVQGAEALGAASLALLVYQVFAVLAGYAAPLLFDRLARQATPSLGGHRLPSAALAALAGLVLLSLTAAGLSATGQAPAWALPLGLMVPAGLAAVAARVHGTVLLARGDYLELSRQATWRLALALATAWLALRWLPAPAAVALALLLTEVATWWRSARRAGRP